MTTANPFMFPAAEEGLPDELAKVLFRMSSMLPEPFYRPCRGGGLALAAGRAGNGLQCRHGVPDPICEHGNQGGPWLG